jgi:hypothetical protein
MLPAVHTVYVVLTERMVNELWSRRDVKGSNHGLIWGTLPEFAQQDWGEPENHKKDPS